ncbi:MULTISPECIES: DUF3077 domain-containing protein [Pseudomonas]|uniref:DUF3077 domain-containing protein n=1 Tax=Pseudomonas TaxID=286 RepID=UPI0005A86F6F|nr:MULTISPECIES: DUF3077 domain-containing protein [Pseudomonas]AZD94860.1 hypothetical protein C4K13_5469 [Pseudomonas chlororaphis subsp. aureofaciens]AZE01187.1 hypothetical protein C4K12_5346 [Pseudomonas chlororaphis subsp. aureofaciens]KAA5834834.1 DUF3077 domain-containing protein [Pseudomonas chlororaphis]KAB0535535.1 DUF3077 domain-containing protein [Pseudomonas chlororaphis subsp. aureofaciens]MBP5062843.1 DUF3077 domain-containing protein [Pseudomonas chlororaphis]
MKHTLNPSPSSLHTLGEITFANCGEGKRPLLRVNANVPLADALEHASLLLHLAKQLTLDAAMEPQADRYAWAAHYLGEMGKAVMDDVHTAMTAGADRH